MTDVPLARAELEALIVQAKAGRAYAQTAVAAATSAENSLKAVVARAENALEALEDDGGGELPVLDIHDAEPVPAGEVAECLVTLRGAQPGASVSAAWTLDDGSQSGGVEFTGEDAAYAIEIETADPGTFVVTLSAPVGATIGRATATGTILPPAPIGDLWERALYLRETPLTAADGPINSPPGTMAGLKSVAMVVKAAMSGKHEKFMGGPSSQSAGQGAVGIGVNPALDLDIWRAGGGQSNKMAGAPKLTAGQPTLLGVAWDGTIALGPPWQSQDLLLPLAVIDGPVYIGAGSWAGNHPIDLIQPGTEILAVALWDTVLTAEEWAQVEARWAHLLVDDGGNGGNGNGGGNGGNGDGLESINTGALRSDIVASDKPRQTVDVGYGWGAGGTDHAKASVPLVRQHASKLFRDLDCRVVRTHNPQSQNFSNYKDITDIAAANGVKFFLCTAYMYAANSNPKALADAVAKALASGVRITHLSPQNEPDGHERNAVKGNYVEHMQELSERLPSSVKLIDLEWRHPEKGHDTFDKLKSAGLAGKGVSAGALHIYNKGPAPALYDQRWATVGAGLWSGETGDMSNPKAPAQFVAGLLYGVVAEVAHIGISTGGNPDDMRQKLLDPNGNPQDYARACGLISRALLPGTVMRGCTSSDRPAGMGSEQAMRMLWAATPRQPRHFVAVGKRPDGKWFLAAVNFAFGSDSPSQWAGGHYAAVTQQLTVRVPGLGNGELIGRICEGNGKVGPERRWAAVDDHTRFTLPPGATVAMVSAA